MFGISKLSSFVLFKFKLELTKTKRESTNFSSQAVPQALRICAYVKKRVTANNVLRISPYVL
jgi:hypothetical protein